MRSGLFGAALLAAACPGSEREVTVRDEAGRGMVGAQVEAVLMPPDDPRLTSVVTCVGTTDAAGAFRYETADAMILTRVKASHPGHHAADADHRHGLGRPNGNTELALTLPRRVELVPLCYREVRLTGLPAERWIGFDAEVGDAIAPWGKGRSVDFRFQISSRQVGWTESAEALAILRRTAEGARMDEAEWAEAYGRFEGSLRLSFPRPGDGLMSSPAFWPYCLLKMPALAPMEGYDGEATFGFDTETDTKPSRDFNGAYLRLRTQLGAGGRITSAHYAKIHGRIEVGPGRAAFRFYYNPRADDRRLAFAPGRNLLRPGPGEPVHRFETQQP